MDTFNYIVLVPMVYLSVAVFIIGCAARLISIFRKPGVPAVHRLYPRKEPAWLYTLADTFLMPRVLKANPVLWLFLILFHAGMFLLVIGHLELVDDITIFQVIPHDIFPDHGVIGAGMFICLLYFLFRRFSSSARYLSVPEDYYLLILLLMTVLFGSELDWARSWFGYQEMGAPEYQAYLKSLFLLHPDISDVTFSGHSFMLAAHVFFANLFIMFFPFSKMMHAVFSIPLNRIRRG
jgi:nitrate reductase gamma subunit